MPSTQDIYDLIDAHEERFARTLSTLVLERPPLHIWMILIPFIFVFWFMRFQKISEGRREFATHYMLLRRRALEEARRIVDTGKPVDIETLLNASTMPPEVRTEQSRLLEVLIEHFTELLETRADDYAGLLGNVYRDRTNYLLFLHRLGTAEKALNKALKPHLESAGSDVEDIIDVMEVHSEELRRKDAEVFFP